MRWETRNSITLTYKADKTWPLKQTRSRYPSWIYTPKSSSYKQNLKINKEDYTPLWTIIEFSHAMQFQYTTVNQHKNQKNGTKQTKHM